MNCLEKRHVSLKAGTQHLGYLDNFMDETDREVMSLTDRAFKSLCIGDEAIYNDSEFSPSPVSCRKPLAEEVPRTTQENCFLAVKKQGAHRLNGVIDTSWQINNDSSLFAAFTAKKNGDNTKITNGDSWDKSALLSIQRELSEFSSDYHNNLTDEHASQVKNHLKSCEKSKDMSTHSGKPSKHSKFSKLKKLNSKNFFLHSEFSPFQSWRELNKFPFGLENLEIFQSSGPPEWYESPLYKKLTMSHRLHVPRSNKECQHSPLSALQEKPEAEVSQQAAQTLNTVPLNTESQSNESETHTQVLSTCNSSEQRCQSEGDPGAPWRKNKSRAKSAVPTGQSIMSSFAYERTKTGEESVLPNKKEVRTMEEQASSSSTPFSISQLLTPVIPSRQGTGNSEVLQTALTPSTLDLPWLPETEMRPSPEIKREGYKSMVPSLLFNLKDNRKRVKTMYSPPKFKALDPDQNKLSPLVAAKNGPEVSEIPEVKSPVHQKPQVSPLSPLPETEGQQNSPPRGQESGGLPDDFLALSLLQGGNRDSPSKPLRAKITYPSLNLYPKAGPVDSDAETMKMLAAPGSHAKTDKSNEKGQNIDHANKNDGKELQRKHAPVIHLNKPTDSTNTGSTHMGHSKTKRTDGEVQSENTSKEKHPLAVLKMHNTRSDALMLSGGRNQDKQNMGGMHKTEQSLVKDKECLKKEPKLKHFFSARQNNYIKSQRCVNADNVAQEETVVSAGRDDDNDDSGLSRMSGHANVREGRKSRQNVAVQKANDIVDRIQDGASFREGVKNDAFGIKDDMNVLVIGDEQGVPKKDAPPMKGNTSAKRALFTSKDQVLMKRVIAPKKDNIVMDKYELAKVALEEVIAEREQRKKKGRDEVKAFMDNYKQVNMLPSSQKDTLESVTKEKRGGQKGISDFKPRSQIVQSMSGGDTKYGESHVAEVNLAGPCKQGGTAEYSQCAAGQIKYTERDRSGRRRQSGTDNVKPVDKVTELEEKVPVLRNRSIMQENPRVTNDDSELAVQKKNKPEVPPRRGRANSQSEARHETDRREDVEGRAVKSGRNVESVNRENVKPNQPADRGAMRGLMSAFKEKFKRELEAQSINVQEILPQGEGPKVDPKKDKIKSMEIVPVSSPAFAATKCDHIVAGIDSDNASDKDSKPPVINQEKKACNDVQSTEYEIMTEKDSTDKKESECVSGVLRKPDDNQNKPKNHCKDSKVREILSGLEKIKKVKPDSDSEKETSSTLETSESFKAENVVLDSVTIHDILKHSKPSPSADVEQEQDNLLSDSSKEKEGSLSKTEGDLTSQTRNHDQNLEQASEHCVSDRVAYPTSDLEKGGWVRCLIESARNLTPTCQSSASSPTMGKLPLFKVKDNTFSSSPVTKTVRPILHKSISEFSQPWSPRESLSGSEKGEQDLFKDCVEMQSPIILSPTPPSTPVQSPPPNPSLMNPISPSAIQFTTSREGKGQLDSLSVPEEDERRSAVSSASEGIESCGTSMGDAVEDTAPKEDTEGSKAPSERSGSACSGTDNQSQVKPPAVPPKTEKALRRAMRLTTRRIQKAETKTKSERKGRSSEKSANHKPERRHHSSDSRSDHIGHSVEENNIDKLLGKTLRSERHARQEKHCKEIDANKKLRHENHGNLISNQADAKNRLSEKQASEKLEGKGLDVRSADALSERLGRASLKYLPDKLDRRAHSLDRYVSDKTELGCISQVNGDPSEKLSTSKRAPVRQNSVEHAYASTTTSIVTQSFPMTQRKLLQDPDSGQYFVVDMPVQIKTKTFFDPETGSYVQLPVRSPEASVPQAQSMEIVNAPPLVLYHGFVPMPITAQKSTFNVGSVISPDNSEVFESSEERKVVRQPSTEPANVSHEHLAKEGAENVR